MLFFRVLDFVMADAVEALDEHHDGGNAGTRDFGGVMEWAGREAMGFGAGFGDGFVAKGNEVVVKKNRLDLPEAFPGNGDVAFLRESFAGRFRFSQHAGEGRGVEVPLIERDATFIDDAGDDAGFSGAGTNCADATVAVGDLINLRAHFRGGEEGVFAAVHRGAAGMRGLPVEGNGVALDAESPEHRPERPIQIEQDWTLLDVQFQVSGCVLQFFAALLHFFEIDPVLFQGGGKGDALFVAERARFIHVEMAGAGGRSEKTLAESRPFLIRPIDETDRDRGPAVVLRMDAAKNFDGGQRVQTAVEPAAVRDGIDVSADEERLRRFAAQGCPKVPGFIGPNIRAERFEFFPEPGPRFRPRLGESHALRAIFVAGEFPKFFEFCNSARGCRLHCGKNETMRPASKSQPHKQTRNIDFQSVRPAGLQPAAEPYGQRIGYPLAAQATCLCSSEDDLNLPMEGHELEGTDPMTERQYVEGKKPDRDIPADKIGRLELATEEDGKSREASGRTSPFWVKCWSCHQYLTRPLSPPSEQAYTCPNCGAVNMI